MGVITFPISGGMTIPRPPAGAEAVIPPPAPSVSLTLYSLEENLLALADTAELVPEEQERQFLAEFQSALVAAVEKRDRVGQFLSHLDAQMALADAEVKRLQERKATFGALRDKVEGYVIRTLESLGPDAKGKPRKLEGKTITFSLRACPASVEVTDEAAVPLDYKNATVKLPAKTWESVLDNLDLETRAQVTDLATRSDAVDKRAVKEAIAAHGEVAGAALVVGKQSLVRK